MKDAEACLAEYLLEHIKTTDYEVVYIDKMEAVIRIKKSWLTSELISLYVSADPTATYFKYRDVKIYSQLAKTALKVVTDRHENVDWQNRRVIIADIVAKLKLDCKEEK